MKKYVFLILAFALSSSLFGQKRFSLPFSSNYDENATVLLGLQYSYIHQSYQLTLKKGWATDYPINYNPTNIHDLGIDNLKSISSKAGSAFSVSIPVDIRATDNLYFTTNPSFLFVNNAGIEYTSTNEAKAPLVRKGRHINQSVVGTNFNAFEFPFLFKFRSDEKILKNKFNRYRGYITGGVRYTRWVGINKEYKELQYDPSTIPDRLIFKSGYPSWEFGLGADIFFQYFKMSPEIKFNQSFNSVFDHKHALALDNKFMAPIERALIRNIYLSIIFQ